jgi:hypothetical protein
MTTLLPEKKRSAWRSSERAVGSMSQLRSALDPEPAGAELVVAHLNLDVIAFLILAHSVCPRLLRAWLALSLVITRQPAVLCETTISIYRPVLPRRIVNGDEMAKLREQGASLREIAKAVGASPGTVRTRLL